MRSERPWPRGLLLKFGTGKLDYFIMKIILLVNIDKFRLKFNNQLNLQTQNCSLLPNNKVNIYSWVYSEISNFLDNAWWTVNIDDSLVDPHFKSIPSLATLSARCFSCSNSKNLCGNPNWAFSLIILILGSGNNLGTCSFQWLDFLASESHSKGRSYNKINYIYLILWISSCTSSPFLSLSSIFMWDSIFSN